MEEQFMENKQGYVIDNMNAVAGCGGIGVGEVTGSSEEILGVKYDEQLHEEHDVGDDDELKYVKEVQQSEKQHSMENVGDGRNSNELAEKEEEVDKYEVGFEEENMHYQQDFENTNYNNANDNTNGHGDHNVCDEMKQIAEDLSPIIGSADTKYVAYSSVEDYQEQYKIEKDGNSMMTNINGSILSENYLQSVPHVEENSSPLVGGAMDGQTANLNMDESFQNVDFEPMPSQLNPEAKVFVPTFESKLLSPDSPSEIAMTTIKSDDLDEAYFGLVPSAVPRHFVAEDDFVAQSPRKGRGDNMDSIFVPAVSEFEEEADQRPHELEADGQIKSLDEIIVNSDGVQQGISSDLAVSQDRKLECDSDFNDDKVHALIDHGPETLVDLDVDINLGEQTLEGLPEIDNDPMKQSIYVANNELIENVLNSVQPIPTDIESVNNSFTEDVSVVAPIGDKELLQIEEKEHISKSPSTEEIQMNLDLSNKDVSQILFDMKDATMMQDGFHTDQAIPTDCNDNSATINSTNLLEAGDAREETLDLKADSPEKERTYLLETHHTENELCSTKSSSKDEKNVMEETKELQEDLHKSSIEHLISEMVDEISTEPHAIDKDESKTSSSSEDLINKCELITVVDENTIGTENESIHLSPEMQNADTALQKLDPQHTIEANADDLPHILEHLSDPKNASLIGSTALEFGEGLTLKDNAPEVLSSVMDCDSISESKPAHSLHQKEIGETYNSEIEQVLCVNSDKEHEDLTETNAASIKQFSNGDEYAVQQNICEKSVASFEKEIQAKPSIEGIVNDNLAEKDLEEIPSEVGNTTSVNAALPLDTRNISTEKKTTVKNTTSALKAKTTSSLSSSSKKLNSNEVAKKPIGAVTKPKLSAVKTVTLSATSDRKPTKTTSVCAPTARKPIVTATAAPKLPLKANVTSRATQVTTSVTKTTTSRPVAALRTTTSALTTARKPAASVNNSAAKTRPASSAAVPAKSNTLGAPGIITSKPKSASPRATATSQMRKPVPPTTAAKSPVKTTIPNSITKTSSSSLGMRPKPAASTASSVGSTAMKTTTARAAPKVLSCSTTSPRRLTVGGSIGGTAATNTATKLSAARKTSPIKPASGKTPTKPLASKTNSNTKSAIKGASPKSTENKMNEQSEMNGGISSDNANNLNKTNGSLQDMCATPEHQQSLLGNVELTKPQSNDSNLETSGDFKHMIIDPLQADLIGAYDH